MSDIPDITDSDMVLSTFALEDIQFALVRITTTIRAIRRNPHWQASDLFELKNYRAQLQRFLPKARQDSLSAEEHRQIQILLLEAAKNL